jgi:hypothetical protein
MIRRYRRGTSALTIFMVMAISLVYLQVNLFASTSSSSPAPARLLTGTLTAHGTEPVTVNGNQLISGTTILSGTQLATLDKSSADVQLRGLGSFDTGPNSSLAVNFNDTSIEITLSAGYVVLTTNKGINGSITTPDGAVVRTDASKVSSVVGRVSSINGIDAAQVGGQSGDDTDNGQDTGEGLLWWLTNNHARLLGLIVFGGLATGGVIYMIRGEERRPCGPQNPSVTLPCI